MEDAFSARTEAVIVGAGPAGLAAAACLQRAGIPFIILERDQRLGAAWHRHYGILILAITIPMSRLPPRLADALTAPILRLVFGDIARLGLRPAPYGPFAQIHLRARIPLIDVGTVDLIRRGHVEVRRGIERFTRAGVVFADDTQEKRFDAVILATGYRPAVSFLENVSAVTDEEGNPRCSGRSMGLGRPAGLADSGRELPSS